MLFLLRFLVFLIAAVCLAAPANLQMRPAWGIRDASDEVLRLAVQLGVKDVVIYGGPGAKNVPGTDRLLDKPRASYEDYLAIRKRLDSYGIRLVAFEGGFLHVPKYHDIVFGGPKRDALIDELIAEFQDMGRAGVPAYGYHWMPLLVWRTKPAKIRGDTEATAFDYEQAKSATDQESCVKLRTQLHWGFMTCEAGPQPPGRKVTEQEMWRHLEYWIKKVTPAAEKAGIRLGIHPDDPPVEELAGLPRIMRNHAAYRRLIEIYPSDSNAIEFCQGTFSEMKDDVYEAIRYFGSRNKILYVHFRNVSAPVPKFQEEFINTGYVDMVKAMRQYRDAGYRGTFIDDHCPNLVNDPPFPGNIGGYRARVHALGYIQGVLDAVSRSGR